MGIPLAILVGLGTLGVLKAGRRDVDYYFPGWASPSLTARELDARFRELTNSPDCLPIMLQAVRLEPSQGGMVWDGVVSKLPDVVARVLPQYSYPDSRAADQWLRDHAHQPTVAQGIAREWSEWSSWHRKRWLLLMPPNVANDQPVFRQLAVATPIEAEFGERIAAARLLTSIHPLSDTEAAFVATTIASVSSLSRAGIVEMNAWQQLAGDLVRHQVGHPVIVAALAAMAPGKRRVDMVAAGVLGALRPDEFPPERVLAPFIQGIRASSRGYDAELLQILAWAEFRGVAASAWGLRVLADQSVATRNTPRPANSAGISSAGPDARFLALINALGNDAAALAPTLLSRMRQESSPETAGIAVSFANVAPHSAENIAAVVPLLTNHFFAAPLLLWLGGAGTNAVDALSAVSAIAKDSTCYPAEAGRKDSILRMDPALARRYGLIPAEPKPRITDGQTNRFKLPSEVRISGQSCPVRWLEHWPGFRRSPGRQWPAGSALAREQQREMTQVPISLGSTTLQEVAEACRRRITATGASDERLKSTGANAPGGHQ